jgi:erythromycin esterase-like protein
MSRVAALLALLAAALAGCAQSAPAERTASSGAQPVAAEARPPQASPLPPDAAAVLRQAARPIAGAAVDYDALLEVVGDARFVLLGEDTHGTHEYYRERSRITERLVRERDFSAVILEADFPETERVNRYVRGLGADRSADEALAGYQRFPRWMWRNAEFRDFVERLRTYNMTQPAEHRVGVYGMDVYALWEAADAVLAYLEQVDKAAATEARTRYRCFAPYRPKLEAYGRASLRPGRSCEKDAAAVLDELRRRARPADPVNREALFSAVRNAASVVGAEEYYRVSYAGGISWNARDARMAATVNEIADHVGSQTGAPGRVVVWAHNTHVGDARATQASQRRELNLGELLRRSGRGDSFHLGFITHSGTVFAAPEWDRPGRVYTVRPAHRDSYAAWFHSLQLPDSLLILRGPAAAAVGARRERAIGVIYLPDMEAEAHYFDARLAEQFDAVIYLDRTKAVSPL